MRDLLDLPLFQWAENLPAEPDPVPTPGVVIDAERRFLAREMNHLRLIVIGYIPPVSGGAPPIYLSSRRKLEEIEPDSQNRNDRRASK